MAKNNDRRLLEEYEEYNDDELLALLDQPEEYQALPDAELDQFVHFAIGVYGITSRGEFIPGLMGLYQPFLQRIPSTQRRENFLATREQVVSGDMSVCGLLPYLCCDTDVGIVSSAALDYAVLHPLEENDLLTGPKAVLQLIGNKTLSCPAAAIGGLVVSGDARVQELVKGVRHTLPNPAVRTVTHCRTGFVYSATIEFYLSWLEELNGDYDDGIFGTIAAALCNLTRGSDSVIRSIERVFPSSRDNGIRLLGSWPLKEYAQTVMPRLQAIARREKEPRIMSRVLETWSIR